MGLLDGLLGGTFEVDVEELAGEYDRLLIRNERLKQGYRVGRNLFLFTNKRLILVDTESMSGRKVAYRSVPYRTIRHFSIEAAGAWDAEAELKIWAQGSTTPIRTRFTGKQDVYELQKVLAGYVL